jgi:hypothetical protein
VSAAIFNKPLCESAGKKKRKEEKEKSFRLLCETVHIASSGQPGTTPKDSFDTNSGLCNERDNTDMLKQEI